MKISDRRLSISDSVKIFEFSYSYTSYPVAESI